MAGLLTIDSSTTTQSPKTDHDSAAMPSSLDDANKSESRTVSPSSSAISSSASVCSQNEDFDNNNDDDSHKKSKKSNNSNSKKHNDEASGADGSGCKLNRKITLKVGV
jgi:hypothetical protein